MWQKEARSILAGDTPQFGLLSTLNLLKAFLSTVDVRQRKIFYRLAADWEAWGMETGLSELELLMLLSQNGLLLPGPQLLLCPWFLLSFPPGGPSGYIHCRLGGVSPHSSQIPVCKKPNLLHFKFH